MLRKKGRRENVRINIYIFEILKYNDRPPHQPRQATLTRIRIWNSEFPGILFYRSIILLLCMRNAHKIYLCINNREKLACLHTCVRCYAECVWVCVCVHRMLVYIINHTIDASFYPRNLNTQTYTHMYRAYTETNLNVFTHTHQMINVRD